MALATLLFLIIDPTVAAHWPVVMTDLPVAILSAIRDRLGHDRFPGLGLA